MHNGRLMFNIIHPTLELFKNIHQDFAKHWKSRHFFVQTNDPEVNKQLKNVYSKIQRKLSNPDDCKLPFLFAEYVEWVQYVVRFSYEIDRKNHSGWECPYCQIRRNKPVKQPRFVATNNLSENLFQLGQPQCGPTFTGSSINNHGLLELMLQAIQYCSQQFIQHKKTRKYSWNK